MPSYNLKSQKRSQSKSKNGGRRKKRTLKNVRRRKSRTVMRGGEEFKFNIDILVNIWVRLNEYYLDRFYIPLLKKLGIDINEQDVIVLKSNNKEAIKQKFESYPGLIDKINDVNSQLYKSLKAEWKESDGK
jgi:uncharacterized protein (UPF0216 family)